MSTLVCQDCKHQNEPERIYCHNCGARLDRSGVIKDKIQANETEVQTQQRLKKMFDPRRGRATRTALKFIKTILAALVTALIVVMLLPPAEIPPETKTYDFAPMINMDLVSAISSNQPATLIYNEEQVNSYLAALLRRKDSPAGEGYFPLRRLFVRFREGECGVNVRRELFSLPVYCGSVYRVRLENGKILADATSGYIGRMPIHPTLVKAADLLLQKAWSTLDRERKTVSKLAGIQFHPQSVTLSAGH
ncbi:MAG TPA: zinc ribbon domain-containing protein [Chthoniobacterales bacterium]